MDMVDTVDMQHDMHESLGNSGNLKFGMPGARSARESCQKGSAVDDLIQLVSTAPGS